MSHNLVFDAKHRICDVLQSSIFYIPLYLCSLFSLCVFRECKALMLLNHNQILNPMPELVKRRPFLEIFSVGIRHKGKNAETLFLSAYLRTPNSKPPPKFVPAMHLMECLLLMIFIKANAV